MRLHFAPEIEQRFLGGLAEAHLADQRQRDGGGHHQLRARILEDAAAERLLLDRGEFHAVRHRRQRCGETGRARPDDDEVETTVGTAVAPVYCINGLAALR